MAKFEVFHYREPGTGRMHFGFGEPFAENAYVKVAEVEAESVEDAYRLTNNIETAWNYNPEVTYLAEPKGCRSTSMGDVIVASGHAFRCASVGWEEINAEEFEKAPLAYTGEGS